MSDITKCEGINCEIKETCWRYLAPTSKYQSYSNFYEKQPCEYYMPVEEK